MTAPSTSTPNRPRPGSPLRAFPALAVALLAALALAGCSVEISAEPVDTETRPLDQSFPLAAGETLRLANLAGAMEVEPGPAGEVRVEATIHAAGRNAGETRELLDGIEWVRHQDGWALSYPVREHSKFHYPREGNLGWVDRSTSKYLGRRVTVVGSKTASTPTLFADLKVFVPAEGAVELRNVVGTIDGGDLAGELTLDTASGDVRVTSFRGELTVDTGSGDVEVGRADGSVSVDTGSGDVDLGEVYGEKVLVDTGSGDVEVGPGRLRSISVDTGSGEIAVRGVDAETMEFDTGSGDIRVESPLDWARTLTADTGSGDVEIYGDPEATFRITADQGSGDLDVRYDDVRWIRSGREVVGAERGEMHTRIEVDTGSGDCVLAPR
jgi:hypothetical protein